MCKPLGRYPFLSEKSTITDAVKAAKRSGLGHLPVRDSKSRQLIGYLRAAELLLVASESKSTIENEIRPLPTIEESELHGEALLKMQEARVPLAHVKNKHGQTVGLLTLDSLAEPVLSGPLTALRRS